MSVIRSIAAASFIALAAGCASPTSRAPSNFAQQWSTLRLGMRLSDVHAAIATPPTKSYETDGDGRIEYWLFATTDFSEVPPAEAYVASFNKEMILTEFRKPRQPWKPVGS